MRRPVVCCGLLLGLAGCGLVGGAGPSHRLVSRAPDGPGAVRVVVQVGRAVIGARVRLMPGARGVVVVVGAPLPGDAAETLRAGGQDVASVDAGIADPAAVAGLVAHFAERQAVTLAGFGPGAAVALAVARRPGVRLQRLVLAGAIPDLLARLDLALEGADIVMLLPSAAADASPPPLLARIVREKGCTPGELTEGIGLQRQDYRCSDGRSVVLQRGGALARALVAAIVPPTAGPK